MCKTFNLDCVEYYLLLSPLSKNPSKKTKSIRVSVESHDIVSEFLINEDEGRKLGKFFGNAAIKEVEKLKTQKPPAKTGGGKLK